MLPFSIMNVYGNTRDVPYVKQMEFGLSTSITNMVMLSSGEVYVGGDNSSGQLGDGTKINKPRQLIQIGESNIKSIHCSVNTTMYITNDDKIFIAGDRAIQNNPGTVAGYSTFTDVSSLFSTINIADIKKVSLEYNTFVLMNNGDLYGIGLNRYGEFGLGTTGYRALTLIGTNVKDVVGTQQNAIYLKNDGTLWGAGRNVTYCIQPKDEGGVLDSNVTTFRQLFSSVQDTFFQVKLSTNNVIAFGANKIYCQGNNANGAFNDGNNTSTNTNATNGTTIISNLVQPCSESNHISTLHRTQSAVTMYVGTDNKLYSCGSNSNGTLGLGISTTPISTFTVVPDVTIASKDIIVFGLYDSYICREENVILGCGNNNNVSGISNDVYTNKFSALIDLPWK